MSDHAQPTNASGATDAILRLLDRPLTPGDLLAGTEVAARPAENSNRQSVRLLLFRIGDETLSLSAGLLRRVTPPARPSPIPHRTAGVVRGVCNIRGELVLCADLRSMLGLPVAGASAADEDSRRMVVIGPADNCWVFEVDALMGVENMDPARFREPPVTVEYSIGAYARHVTDFGGKVVTVLDGERVLAGFKAGLS